MNSTIEYIRQLNQSSVAIKDEWLDRLRNVDAGPDSAVPTPEIVLTRDSSIRNFDEREYEAPVTVISKPTESDAPAVRPSTTGTTPTAEHPAPVSIPDSIDPPETTDDTAMPQSLVLDSECTAETVQPGSMTFEVHAPVMPTIDSSEQMQTEETSSDAAPASQPDPPSELTDSETTVPVEGTSRVLETSSRSDGIVRPTIMPLRQEPGPDVLAPGEFVAPASSSSIMEVIQGLEGLSGEARLEPTAASAASAANSPNSPDTADTVDFDDSTDTYVDPDEACLGPALNIADAPPAATATFPSDRLGQRFTYELCKRQKLVDSIVDQIAGRFPPAAASTILLVGSGREIDIESAASRIATCMATRDMGRILLVDGNLASRQLSAVLGLDQQAGVAEMISQEEPANSLLCATDNERLMILPAGREQIAASKIDLSAASLTNKSFKNSFDYTIIGGAQAGDALTDAWAALVDGIYLLIDVDESDREVSRDVVEHFRNMGARVVGCIATRS